MNVLIINMLPSNDSQTLNTIINIKNRAETCTVVNAFDEPVHPCKGCYYCWFNSPGVCIQKDICESIIKAYLKNDTIIYITPVSLGTFHFKTKNIIDRVSFCSITPLYEYRNGEMFHCSRYNKNHNMAIIYKGIADNALMNSWLERAVLNINGVSIGAYDIENIEELLKCIQ